MPIAPLPDSTARAIGSILVLNDACSVVKELLDNALDAQATTITVEISANALDVIQVKDNGSGINPEDRKLLCKRSHTSKIETLEDLQCVGGTSLGFRGEALWSIAELSKAIIITTRTEGETAGEVLEFDQPGELASLSKTSHPIGTIVRVQEFLQKVPVRRQTALKSFSKTLNNVKKLLQSYVFARPEIRLSLRVLKGKDPKSNWTYAPKHEATMSDAAMQLAGQDVLAQCSLKSFVSGQAPENTDSNPDNTAQIDRELGRGINTCLYMLLPKRDCDLSKVTTGGQHISIDRRPLSNARGTPKEIVKMFKLYLQSAFKKSDYPHSLSNPFLCLHIHCTRGSYDVNVEPAKDDVLFGDPREVLHLAENIFKSTYGDRALEEQGTSYRSSNKNGNAETEFDLFLAQNPKMAPRAASFRKPALNMYETISEDEQAGSDSINTSISPAATPAHRQPQMESEDDTELRSAQVKNPWSLAKLHGKNPPRPIEDGATSRPEVPTQPAGQSTRSNCLSTTALPSFQRPRQAFSGNGRFSPPKPSRDSKRQEKQQLNIESGSYFDEGTPIANGQFPIRQNPQQSSPSRSVNPPFISPAKTESSPRALIYSKAEQTHDRSPATLGVPFQPSTPASALPHRIDSQSKLLTPPFKSPQINQPTLASLMDYEHRKRSLIALQRQHGKQSPLPKVNLSWNENHDTGKTNEDTVDAGLLRSSPYQNRYQAAKAVLNSEKSLSPSKILDSDPRAYLMRDQDKLGRHSKPGPKFKLKRLKTTFLPLETIPADARVDNVNASLPEAASVLSNIAKGSQLLRDTDHYVLNGKLEVVSEQWTHVLDETKLLVKWNKKIGILLDRRINAERQTNLSLMDHPSNEFQIDLPNAIKAIVAKP